MEGSIVGIRSHGIGLRLLLRERHVIFHTAFLSHPVGDLGYLSLEKLAVVGRDGEVHLHVAVAVGSCLCTLGELLFDGSAATFGIGMEFEQPLGQTAVVEAFGLDDGGYYLLETLLGLELVNALAVELTGHFVEIAYESDLVDVGD